MRFQLDLASAARTLPRSGFVQLSIIPHPPPHFPPGRATSPTPSSHPPTRFLPSARFAVPSFNRIPGASSQKTIVTQHLRSRDGIRSSPSLLSRHGQSGLAPPAERHGGLARHRRRPGTRRLSGGGKPAEAPRGPWHNACPSVPVTSDSTGQSRRSPLLESVSEALMLRHYSSRTREAYVSWVRRFVVHHHLRHPQEMGPREVSEFLSHLATNGQVTASTQNQALAALLFLYGEVLHRPLEFVGGIVHAKRPVRLPVVLGREEVKAVFDQLSGPWHLMASLLYGSGLRLLECVSLRVKDIDFSGMQILILGPGEGVASVRSVGRRRHGGPARCAAGQARSPRSAHDHDLHARAAPRPTGREESAGPLRGTCALLR